MDDKQRIQADKEIIEVLGGPTRVAELLGFDKARGGVQRVQNWMTRGIPPKEKIARPDLFLRELSEGQGASTPSGRRVDDPAPGPECAAAEDSLPSRKNLLECRVDQPQLHEVKKRS